MQKALNAVAASVLVRSGILVALLAVAIVPFLPQHFFSIVAVKAMYHLGVYLIAIAIGGIAGWLTFSRSVWWKTTVSIGAIILFLQLGSMFFLPS